MLYRFFAFLAFGLVVFGCSRSGDDAFSGPVVARIGGHTLTEGELNARQANIVALFSHRMGARADQKMLAGVGAAFTKGYPDLWVEDRVLEDYAKAKALSVDPDLMEEMKRGAFGNFKAKGDRDYEGMIGKLSGFDERLWADQMRSEALRKVVSAHWAELYPTNLPPTFVEDFRAKIDRWNAGVAVTNAATWARATNVWQRLKGGAEFAEMARQYAEVDEEREDGGDWAVVDEKFLSDEPEFLKRVRKLKVGEFTPPFEGDNGILIVRLDRLEDEGGYALSRIFFRRAQLLEAAPAEKLIGDVKKRHAERIFNEKLKELVNAAKAEKQEVK